MNKLTRTRAASERTVRIETEEGEWFAWLRTRTPLLGARRDRLIRLRPGGTRTWQAVAIATAATALAGLAGAGGVAVALAAITVALTVIAACTIPWVPQQRRYAQDLRPGDLIRVPRHPLTAGIVIKADTYDGLTYVELHGEHHMVFENRREVARIYLDGKLAHQWIYGRIPAQTMQHRDRHARRSWRSKR